MILQGVLDRSLDNFVCLRGYARLGDLFEVSEPDPSYQRDLIQHQQERMEKFLDDGEYLFFPEVILGASLSRDSSDELVRAFIREFNADRGKQYRFSQFKLNYSVTSRKAGSDRRDTVLYRRAAIDIKDSNIESGEFNKFHRIDGNHRLSILSDNLETKLTPEKIQRYQNLNVPYCIVLFNDDEKLQRFSRALFHNVNYRQIALTMEQSLKQILEDTELFSDEVVREKFGKAYHLARKVLQSGDLNMIPNISQVISPSNGTESKRTFLLQTFEILAEKKLISLEESDVDDVVKTFKSKLSVLNSKYANEHLGNQQNSGLLSAFFYYAYQSEEKLNMFNAWILRNHIYQTQDTKAQEIIKIFDCVLEARKRTIFVSMQFSDDTKCNYEAIDGAVKDVNHEYKLDISIENIRIDQFDKGFSYEINDEILRLIEESGLLIADLTMGNKNVYHEIGYLMGLNQGKGLKQENFILLHNGSIGDSGSDIGFNLSGIKQLRVQDTNTLREDIKKQIEIYYGLVK